MSDFENLDSFAERLLFLRNGRKMTQSDLAERLNVTKASVSAYERGVRLPSYDVMSKVSRIFGISVDELISPKNAGSRRYSISTPINEQESKQAAQTARRAYVDIADLTSAQQRHVIELVELFREGINKKQDR